MRWFDRRARKDSDVLFQDVEILLSGGSVERTGLHELEIVLAEMRVPVSVERESRETTQLVLESARLARRGDLKTLTRPVVTHRRRRLAGWTPAAAAATAVFVFGAVPVAIAANGSAPGDPLYGINRALERVGIMNGGFDERLAEVDHLNSTGRHGEALAHLEVSLSETRGRLGDRQTSLSMIQLEIAAQGLGSDASEAFGRIRRALAGSHVDEGGGPGTQGNQGNQGGQNQGNQDPGSQGNQGNQNPGSQGNQNPGSQGNQGNQGSENPGNPGNQSNQNPVNPRSQNPGNPGNQGNQDPGSGNQGNESLASGNQGAGADTDGTAGVKPGLGLGRDR
jgi:hypothetical protein